ncbi:MerR family transcriptional regulator [Mycolicibacterium lutetiense]|uniref:DNA-binding protein n=1 Tax=Mycolicibacterium lutetiense TaxID=1641992 RepID=A0ABS4ZSR0_9MYCO|nr:hypothetical protein [Mycolicibacterium lutetiense]MBP2452509.1 hypothetical protein [Mycolicibacterium lutetiense]
MSTAVAADIARIASADAARAASADPIAAVLPEGTPALMTVSEAAEFFGVQAGTVRLKLRSGGITPFWLPHPVRGLVKGVSTREAALIWGSRRLANVVAENAANTGEDA